MNNKLNYKYCISFDFESYHSNRIMRFTDLDSLYKLFNEDVLTLTYPCKEVKVKIPPTHEGVAFDVGIVFKEEHDSYGDFSYFVILSKEKKENLSFVDTLEDIAEHGFDMDKVKKEIEQIYNVLI